MEIWTKNKEIYNGKIFKLLVGDVKLDDGKITQRDVILHSGGIAIVPIFDDSIIFVRQFRISIEREILELPAGRIEKNESPMVSAKRELEEETGFQADDLVFATSYYSSVGFTNEKMYIYLAFNLKKIEQKLEWDERIKIVKIPISEIGERLHRKEFEDSKTIIGLREYLSYSNKVK